MTTINLQDKTEALEGIIESYWFENESIGLINTLFHRFTIPLKPFESGFEYDEQPLETEIVLDWYALGLDKPEELDGLNIAENSNEDAEGSVYVGCAHNSVVVKKLALSRLEAGNFNAEGELHIEFENEGVGNNEIFKFSTTLKYQKT
ncbi:hypothetical protein F9L16_01730 [Agarivorans sp. B2Z047]|uniref:hypothetical protein n=1 Tax=Agarivorans sp. B2Z047 TaxID=2652721 RepID=UPI00128D6B13|nr:hypothetical protein [Agarivorans sp. B2Z047]MPW27719.1 hypothetical protein [Agarivorans sp. B2Z047]UQN44442.1 hypothetical protein LQZ07_08235 [Agarivorans sp. B2Z047]